LIDGLIPSNDGHQDSEYIRARKQWLIGYDRTIPRMRQADHCIGCNHCLSQCPQHIDIPREMHRVDEYIEQLKQSI